MANHPNRASKTFYSTRLRAERAAGRKLVELLEVGTASNADLWDVALASPREGDLLGLVMLSRCAGSRIAAAVKALRDRQLVGTP
jgi:hypothetical protein